jgi:hypothetical protein
MPDVPNTQSVLAGGASAASPPPLQADRSRSAQNIVKIADRRDGRIMQGLV